MLTVEQLTNSNPYPDLESEDEAACPKLATAPARSSATGRSARAHDPYVGSAQLPNGQRIRLLKSVLSSACERNCFYCPFRAGRDFRRETYQPDEYARTFMALQRGGVVEGIFLSSGIAGGSLRTQDQLLATAEILRRKHLFAGYLHLKLMPGAEQAQVEQALRLADRVSINLEAPNAPRLERLAPRKQFFEELLAPLRAVDQIRRQQPPSRGWKGRWPSLATQFVVGPAGETDLELLQTTEQLHRRYGLARAYFSAFNPIPDTPFENLPGEAPQRQDRLYQASFLLRDYGFDLEELPFDAQANLPRNTDPKLAWARSHLAEQPLELNQAESGQLLRVPGIGPKGAASIVRARRLGRLRSLDDLRRLGINPQRPADFILLDGQRPTRQLALF